MIKRLILTGLLSTMIISACTVHADKDLPRSVRNNNPGNLEKGNKWFGESRVCHDKRFECFETPEWGARALIITLTTYYNDHNLRTVLDIIHRWAPPNENNTRAYLHFIEQRVGMSPYYVITDMLDIINLAIAISEYEAGGAYFPPAVWIEALWMVSEQYVHN